MHSATLCGMSISVRLPDYLAAEVKRLADQDKRSLAKMVQILLVQAMKMDGRVVEVRDHAGRYVTEVETRTLGPGAAMGELAGSGSASITRAGEPERAAPETSLQASSGFATPQGRQEAERVFTGEEVPLPPITAPRGFKPDFKGERK